MPNGYTWRTAIPEGSGSISLETLHALYSTTEPALNPTTGAFVTSAVAAEATLRSSADAALASAYALADSLVAAAAAAAVSAESTSRTAADTTLQTNITAEATARGAADTTLATNLATEATYRSNGDAGLQALLDALAAVIPHSGTLTPALATLYASGPRYHVAAYGAIAALSDSGTKALNDSAIDAAVAAIKTAGGGTLWFGNNTYYVTKSRYVHQVSNLSLAGDPGATIVYPSDDTGVTTDATRDSLPKARGAFYLHDSDNVTVRDLAFRGSSVSTDLTVNVGVGVYARQCTDLHLFNCRNDYGAALVNQDATTDDSGIRLTNCVSYGARGNVTLGYDPAVLGCRFELPTSSDYDRTDTTHGSTHAIYLFAARRNAIIQGNIFKNIRTQAIKGSGSSIPIRLLTVIGNIFDDCGGATEFGADDRQEHAGLIFLGNHLYNCATNKVGWNEGQAVHVLGARSVMIDHNFYYYTRDSIASASGVKGIFVSRYVSSSSPIEQVGIKHNQFQAILTTAWTTATAYALNFLARPTTKNGLHYACTTAGTSAGSEPTWPTAEGATVADGTVVWTCRGTGDASAPGSILTQAIYVAEVGAGAATYGSAQVLGNQINSVGTIGIYGLRNVGLVVDVNTFNNIATPVQFQGNRFPVFGDKNIIIPGASSSSNAQLRMSSDSFPIIHLAPTAGRLINAAGQSWTTGDNANGSTAVDFPLLGTRGRAMSSAARPEIVFAYGDGWLDGDTVNMNGTTFTYKASSPGAAQFNTAAGLIALIDAMANIGAADYGAQFSPAVTTNHIRVRYDTALNTASAFFVRVTAVNPTAGVVLSNGTGANPLHCFARGEGTAPGSKTVIWSPLANWTANPLVNADNAAAATRLVASGSYVTGRSVNDSGAALVIEHGSIAGTEEFRWSLGS